jgi:hypothetical protein
MNKDEIIKLSQEIETIASNFEEKPYTENVKLLKDDFSLNNLITPNSYLETIDQIEEILRQTRLLFLYSVFNILCKVEGKNYSFEIPYQANMKYTGIMKKDGSFYLLDEDGDYREMFVSERFVQFVKDSYWQLYEQE